MQKIQHIVCLLATFVTAVLMSCSSGGNDGENKTYRIGVAQCSSGHWRDKLNSEMQRELLLHEGITMEIVCADDNDEKQIEQIQHFIDDKVDLIIASPNMEEPLTEVISKAYDSGIPVVLFDRNIKGNKYTAFVGGDNIGVGQQLACFAVKCLPNGGKVIELKGRMSSSPARQRHQGFIEELKKHPSVEVVASIDALWDGPIAAQVTDSLLRVYPDVDVIVAHSDWMASTSREAVLKSHPDSKIRFVGADGFGSPGIGVYAVENGTIDATAIYPTGGDIIMQTAIAILKGEEYKRETLLPSYIVSDGREAGILVNMYKELEHEVNTILALRDHLVFLDHQHELEQTLRFFLIGFLVVAIGLCATLYRLYVLKRRTNIRLNAQQEELRGQRDQLLTMTSELEQATNAKLVFFTNISHDFRTPLTLISAPIETIISEDDKIHFLTRQARNLLNITQRNVNILLDLVNQILDFRKVENGMMAYNLSRMDIKPALTDWVNAFRKYTEKRNITIDLKMESTDWVVDTDIKKLERIIYNLLGNAVKFTPEGGCITVRCLRLKDDINISIKDNGCGIPKDKLRNIFERFYQIDNLNTEGSGIGLELVKTLVEFMDGKIEIHSSYEEQPTGTEIIVTLPVNYDHQTDIVSKPETDTVTSKLTTMLHVNDAEGIAETTAADVDDDDTVPVALIIDDNADIRQFLLTLLSNKYKVLTAADGKKGLKIAEDVVPDIILCDVMMPVMDGIECCQKLKDSIHTCHIPVLMLTACSLDEQRILGLSNGAEAYIAKPFSSGVLMAQMETLLRNRQIIESRSDKNILSEYKNSPQLSRYDREFLKRLTESIERNYSDESFSVEKLASDISLSRTQVCRKCKALTGETPVEMIRNARLQQARKLIYNSSEAIMDIAKAVGFSDASYFTKCYKGYFGVTPTEEKA